MINFFTLLIFSCLAFTQTASDKHLSSIDVENMLGKEITSELMFSDESNKNRTIQSLLDTGVPLILVMAYYECPMLCSLVLNGLSNSINNSGLIPGVDFNALTLSIDHEEGFELASDKKNNYMSSYFDEIDSEFWYFGTTSKENIHTLTNELGFNYSYDSETDQYAHPAVVYVLSDQGLISKQLFGIDIEANSLRLAVLEAQESQISSIFDKILLYCYKYNPKEGSYSMVASNVMKLAGASTVLAMGTFLSIFWLKESRA